MRRARIWWLVTVLVWALGPFVVGFVESYFRFETPLPLGAILALALLDYLWVVPGVVASLASGGTVRRRVLATTAIVLGAAFPYVLWQWVLPLVWDTRGDGVGWALFIGIPLTVVLTMLAFAGLLAGWVIAGDSRARALWSIPIGLVLLLGSSYLPLFVYPIANFGTVTRIIAVLVTVVSALLLAWPRTSQPNSLASLETPSDRSESPSA